MKLKKNREEEKRRRGEEKFFSFSKFSVFSLILVLFLFGAACQPNQTILKDAAPPSPTPLATAETKKTTLEQDLRDMQAANFDYIFVFRRKDGGEFDEEDRKFLRQNTPLETNRWTKSDDGRAFIAGSGFAFTPEQMQALQNRFVVEDHSKPEVKEAANKPANANKGNANSSNANR